MKTETKLKCGNCENGIVTLVVRDKSKGVVEAFVKKCTSCKKEYGLKGVSALTQI